jgi:hypothetical protein
MLWRLANSNLVRTAVVLVNQSIQRRPNSLDTTMAAMSATGAINKGRVDAMLAGVSVGLQQIVPQLL